MSLLPYGLSSALALLTCSVALAQPTPDADAPIGQGPQSTGAQTPPPADAGQPAPPAAPSTISPSEIPPPSALIPPTAAPADTPATPPAPAATPPEAAASAPGPTEPGPAPAPAPPPALVAPAPAAVQATPLAAPDLFSTEAGSTGLPNDLWQGASVELARTVIPLLSSRPLTPAAASFGRRLMSTAALAPAGGGSDPDLAAARIGAVLALGDAAGAREMLAHTPDVRQSAALSEVAAEADLVLGREDEACAVGDALASGKDGAYWRRLRAWCLLKAGDKPGAQLAFDLAAEQSKDEVYKRLMGAALNGGPPGGASLRNGLDFALSRRLQLDLGPALAHAWTPIAVAVVKDPTASPDAQAAAAARAGTKLNDLSSAPGLEPAVRDAAASLADDKPDGAVTAGLVAAGGAGSSTAQAASALYIAAGAPANGEARLALAGFDIGRSTASQSRMLEMEAAQAKGDAALMALWLAIDAGAAGPGPVDRARIVSVLIRAGFAKDARAYALEGLLGLQTPPPAPARRAPPRRKR